MAKKICVDLDGTLCTNTKGEYEKAIPLKEAISKINYLYDKGNYIIIYTARYMGTSRGDVKKVYKTGYQFTLNQLKKWDVKFNELIMGKPEYDLIIDDKCITFDKNWFKKKINLI